MRFGLSATAALSAAGLLLAAQPATAVTAGNGGGASQTDTFVQLSVGSIPAYFVTPAPENEEEIVPYQVVLNASAGPWIKRLAGEGSTTAPLVATEGFEALVFEFIEVDGATPWDGWHEDIVTPGWVWSDTLLGVSFAPSLATITDPPTPIPGVTVDLNGTSLEFTFPASFADGTAFAVAKVLTFVGTDPNNSEETFAGFVEIHEYPVGEVTSTAVPEPMTAGLGAMALAAAGAAVTRRRSR